MFKIIIGVSISTLFIFSFFVSALSPIPNPTCFIEGKIVDVNFAEAEDHSLYRYDDKGEIIAHAPGPQYPDRFVLDILVDQVELVSEIDSLTTCNELYPIEKEVEIYIPTKDVTDENDLKTGNLIKGEVLKPFAHAYFREYSILPMETKSLVEPPVVPTNPKDFLTQEQCEEAGFYWYNNACYSEPKLSIATDVLGTDEISKKLLQENHIDGINSISLEEDQQTYNVQGVRQGRLFFLIPVTYNIQLEVDAITNVIKVVRKSWWSFLVR